MRRGRTAQVAATTHRKMILFWLVAGAMPYSGSTVAATVAEGIQKAPNARLNASGWTRQMRELGTTLQSLLLDASSEERFNAPKNAARIRKSTERLATLAQELDSDRIAKPDHDPSLKLIAHLFDDEASRARKLLDYGHREYARGILRGMSGYCMACHTRNAMGPQLTGIPESLEVAQMPWLDRANYLAATRNFDQSLATYEKGIQDPVYATQRPFDWERAVRSALALSIRVKQDPDRALVIVDRVLAMPSAPYFMREQAAKWKESLVGWKAEPRHSPWTDEGLFAETIRLTTAAKQMQKYPADRSADVIYLRATASVHDLLSRDLRGERLAEALYLAGLGYEVLQGLNFWDLHDYYYLSCIEQAPHTEVARRCFGRFQESVFAGYTGSAGTDIPPEVEARLKQMEALSKPSAPQSLDLR